MLAPFFNPAWPLHRRARDEHELVTRTELKQELAGITTVAPVPDDPKGSEAWFDEDMNIFDDV